MVRVIAGALAALALMLNVGTALSQETGQTAVATFGSGCFWCTESDFDKVPGVLKTTSGYMGGKTENPTYDMVSSGRTGHAEVVQVTYDPSKVSYEKLLDVYIAHLMRRSAIPYVTPTQRHARDDHQILGTRRISSTSRRASATHRDGRDTPATGTPLCPSH